jgi:hypothetical protein
MRRNLHVLAFLVLFVVGCERTSSLPPTSEIESMRAVLYASKHEEDSKFVVSHEHWAEVWDVLSPARRDYNPSKWEMLGELEVVTQGGGRRTVWLFSTSTGPGAFAVGTDWDHRVYYRGGTTDGLLRALEAAHEASQDK